jgi:hypothetical protein
MTIARVVMCVKPMHKGLLGFFFVSRRRNFTPKQNRLQGKLHRSFTICNNRPDGWTEARQGRMTGRASSGVASFVGTTIPLILVCAPCLMHM